MAEEAKAEKKARAPRATSMEITLMCTHLSRTHKVDPFSLYGKPFGELSTLHNTFHGQDDHWREGK